MSQIEPEAGAAALRRALDAAAESLGLSGEPSIEWFYNPGNFENASYRVADGTRELHVKVVGDPAGPDVWHHHRRRLEREYRAPPMLARLPLVGGAVAYVFPRLPGRAPEAAPCLPWLDEATALLTRLHADREFAAELADGPRPPLDESFPTGMLECLTEDLATVRSDVEISRRLGPTTVAWLETEAAVLAEEGRRRLPPAPRVPIHGDSWLANFLLEGSDWWLLDWDDLRPGDPAADLAMLLFEPWIHGIDPLPRVPEDLRDRVDFILKAATFDAIVDPLSDVSDMPPGVPNAEGIVEAKWRVSTAALARYRRLYGG